MWDAAGPRIVCGTRQQLRTGHLPFPPHTWGHGEETVPYSLSAHWAASGPGRAWLRGRGGVTGLCFGTQIWPNLWITVRGSGIL